MATARAQTVGRHSSDDVLAEHQLLLACGRVAQDAHTRERVQHLAALELDWHVISETAALHGIAPLVYHHLAQTAVMPATDTRMTALRAQLFLNTGNSLMLARELDEVLRWFAEAGIAAIPYKGPVLAASLYGNMALRQFTDLDVVVKPADVLEAKSVLVRHGYEPQTDLTPVQERAIVAARSGYFFRFDRPHPAGRVAFELHWRIPAPFSLDDGYWQRLRYVRLLEQRVRHFAPEDLLLILCAHGFKHAWNRLKWISDVAQAIEVHSDALDWDFTLDEAARVGGVRALLLGCALVRTALKVHLPAGVVALIERDSVVCSLASVLQRRLFDCPLPRAGVINNFRIRDRVRDRIRYGLQLAGHLTVPTAAERASWPTRPGASVVRYLTHPIRLAARVARKYRR